ncbi:unnamed protein product [Effrenium voratum]|uniref:Uncharacterized protein n=1 Tax=Effrenium voratum TaxID=2562239 RepID=A0AA36JJU1_9DINO|nr:unnamed protein product [Effrenium voratum]
MYLPLLQGSGPAADVRRKLHVRHDCGDAETPSWGCRVFILAMMATGVLPAALLGVWYWQMGAGPVQPVQPAIGLVQTPSAPSKAPVAAFLRNSANSSSPISLANLAGSGYGGTGGTGGTGGDSGTGSYEKIQGVIHAKINQENFLEAWGEAASSSAHLLGVVARGGKVEASQGIEIAGGVVSALTSLKIMDPVLGFALGMFSSFFSAFYEEGPDKYIMDIVQTVVPDLIEDALVKQTLQRAEDNLGNFQEDEDMWDQLARADPAARKFQCYSKIPNYNNARPDMFGDCWHGAADYPVSEGCSKFVLGGGIKAANMFALTHINVLRSCASADNSGADAYINEAHRLRAVYMLLLRQTVGFLVREWKEKMPSPKMLTYVSDGVFAGGECTGWWPTDTVDPVTGKRFVQDCNLPEADCNFVGYDEMNKPIDDCTNAYKERTFSNFEQQWLFANQFLLAYKPPTAASTARTLIPL